MKQYLHPSNLTLVGKSWEIRHQLRIIARKQRQSGNAFAPPMLKDYLEQQTK